MRTVSHEWLPFRWLDDLRRDTAYAVRSLSRSPGFTTAAVLTLSVGIGATTAIYSVVDTILLQPLPFADADRLVRVVENIPFIDAGRPPVQRGVTYQEFLEWRSRARTLSDAIAVIGMAQRTARTSNGTMRLWGSAASGPAFALLGARAFLGRTLTADDDAHPDVAVLTFDAWRRLFHSDRGVVGSTIELRGTDVAARLLTVVGVLAADFEFPTGNTDFYTPIALDPSRRSPFVAMIARLNPGVSLKDAIDEANVIGAAVRPPRPADAPPLSVPRFDVQRLKDRMVEPLRPALRVLLTAVGVVLVIACANVANLLLARGVSRQREMAVRFGLGASRGRLVRQILTECLVLAIAGGALGALVAAAGVTLVKQLATVEAPGIFRLVFGESLLPRGNEVGVDLKMLAIAFTLAAIASLVFGVLPALHLSRTSDLRAMASRGGSSGRGESRTRAALAVGQLVMATALLVAAGLLMHSFTRLSAVDTGYNPSNVLAFQLVFPAEYAIARKAETIESLLTRLRAVPGVESAGFSRAGILIAEELVVGTFVPQGRSVADMRAEPAKPRVRSVSHGYLTTMGVQVLDGRELAAADTAAAPPVIVINRTVARRYFGAGSPVGQFVDWYPSKGPPLQVQVVGVVEDVRNTTPDREAFPEVFVDYRQLLTVQQRWGDSTQQQDVIAIGFLSFAVRTTGDPKSAIPAVTRIVRSIDPNAGIESILPMRRLVASNLAKQRFNTVLLGVFAGVAGFLAAVGVYGVLAYAVIQRTREIGIRMALGAQRAQVLAIVLRKGLILTTIGIALGIVAAAAGARFLQGMLFGITPLDPTTFAVVAVMFGLVAAFACYMPARRATKVDPIAALRSE
jgi:putative ABC transport system permease protein